MDLIILNPNYVEPQLCCAGHLKRQRTFSTSKQAFPLKDRTRPCRFAVFAQDVELVHDAAMCPYIDLINLPKA